MSPLIDDPITEQEAARN